MESKVHIKKLYIIGLLLLLITNTVYASNASSAVLENLINTGLEDKSDLNIFEKSTDSGVKHLVSGYIDLALNEKAYEFNLTNPFSFDNVSRLYSRTFTLALSLGSVCILVSLFGIAFGGVEDEMAVRLKRLVLESLLVTLILPIAKPIFDFLLEGSNILALFWGTSDQGYVRDLLILVSKSLSGMNITATMMASVASIMLVFVKSTIGIINKLLSICIVALPLFIILLPMDKGKAVFGKYMSVMGGLMLTPPLQSLTYNITISGTVYAIENSASITTVFGSIIASCVIMILIIPGMMASVIMAAKSIGK